MKNNFRYLSYFLGIVCSIAFLSCLDEDYFLEQFEKKYNKQWEKLFGKMDPEHDWNIISQIEAIVDVPAGGEYTARIYTTHPKDKRSRLVAQIPVEGTGSIRFDLEKISKDVYARVKDAQGKTAFEGYFVIDGHEVFISQDNARSGSISRAETTEQVPDALSSLSKASTFNVASIYRDGANEWNEITWFDNNNTNGLTKIDYDPIKYVVSPGINGHDRINGIEANEQLENIYNSDNQNIACVKFKDFIYNIVRSGGVFDEGGSNLSSNTDNRRKEGMSDKVVYVTQSSGPVELSYVYGNTGLHSAMGYFYWKEGQDYQSAPKIVFMNNALPHHNLKVSSPNRNNNSPAWIDAITLEEINTGSNGYGIAIGDANENNHYVFGPKYKLVYYGENYDSAGSYNFPEGVHIGFFLFTNYWDKDYNSDGSGSLAWGCQSPMNIDLVNPDNNDGVTWGDRILRPIFYSIPDYNKENLEYYNYRTSQDSKSNGPSSEFPVQNGQGEISAVTYKYQGNIILGFEDGVDKDMNDILLLVEADVLLEGENSGETEDFIEEDNNYTEPEPEPQSWIIACEDLGSIGDYDFNDAVFKVGYVAGSNQLTVTPLASGGTYNIEVLYKDTNIGEYVGKGNCDFHMLINENAGKYDDGRWKQINDKEIGTAGAEITITDESLRSGFSLANGDYTNHGFSVYVEKNNGASITINQPMLGHKAPQMLVLPEYWIWPYEGKIISAGYPDFESWTNKQNIKPNWYTSPLIGQGLLVSNDTSGYPSAGGNSGNSGTGSGSGSNGNVTGDGFPFYINDIQQENLPLDDNNNVVIPTSYFNQSGDEIAFYGKDLIIGFGDGTSYRDANPVIIEITAEMLKGKESIAFGLWCNAADVEKICIKYGGTGGGSTEPEDPEDPETPEELPEDFSISYTLNGSGQNNLTIGNGISQDKDGYYYLTVPKSAFSASGAKIDFTIIGTKLVSGSILNTYGKEHLSTFHYDPNMGTNTAIKVSLTAEQIAQLPEDQVKIYFWTGLSTVTAMNIGNMMPTSIPLTVDNQSQEALNVIKGDYGYYLLIQKSHFNGNAAAIDIALTGESSVGGRIYTNSSNDEDHINFAANASETTIHQELTAEQVAVLSDPVKVYFWNNDAQPVNCIHTVTGITVTNATTSSNSITVTVNGESKPDLSVTKTTNDLDKIFIPIDYFTGNNGATIYFTSDNIINENGQGSQQGGGIKEGGFIDIVNNKLTLTQADISYNNTDQGGYVTIFLPNNNTYGITAITIVNHNSIPVTVNGDNKDALTIGQDGSYTIPLSSYGLGSNGATITFNGNATIKINGNTYSFNSDWSYTVNDNNNLTVEITNGTINSITIVPKAADTPSTGGITFTVDGNKQDDLTLTTYNGNPAIKFEKSLLGNNGATITFNSDSKINGIIYCGDGSNANITVYFEANTSTKQMNLTASQVSNLPNDVYIIFYEGSNAIKGISINKNTDSDNGTDDDVTDEEEITTDGITISADGKTATISKSTIESKKGNNGITISVTVNSDGDNINFYINTMFDLNKEGEQQATIWMSGKPDTDTINIPYSNLTNATNGIKVAFQNNNSTIISISIQGY